MNRFEEVMQRIGSRPALIRASSAGDYYADPSPYRIEDGVAIIDISGPLLNEKCDCGGCTFYGDIQDQLKRADSDPAVKGVLLNVNSPGGQTDNAFETAAAVAKLGKPCYAYAGTMAYSAAYLAASQARKIYCAPVSGGVGSIGVYSSHLDFSGMLDQAGVKVTLLSAGKGKTDGNPYEPLSVSARETIQAEVDRLYGEFVGAVARGRGIDAAEIVKMGARCVEGAGAAIAARLADMPGDLSTACADLRGYIQTSKLVVGNGRLLSASSAKSSAASAARRPEEGPIMTDDKVQAEAKDPTAAEIEAMVTQARADGFNAATEIVVLCAIAGMPTKAAGFITSRAAIKDVQASLMAAKVEAEKGTEMVTGVMPGESAEKTKEGTAAHGKAKPWREVLRALGFAKKEEK